LPAGAQQISDECKLSRRVNISITVPGAANDVRAIYENSLVSSSASRMVLNDDGDSTKENIKILYVSNEGTGATGEGGMGVTESDGINDTIEGQILPQIAKKWGTVCLINTINTITDWAFFILLSISFVFIAFAGLVWMTSQGDPEKQGKAGKMIMAALVGIVIAIMARVIPGVITGILI
jgi:hypothetical protein